VADAGEVSSQNGGFVLTDYTALPYSLSMFERITFNPKILHGKACIRGMRIPVSLVVNLVASGMTTEEILREYPDLEAEDIRAALEYAAALLNEEIHPLTLTD
jgi:uncharacterized protein (DUF433 family)